VRVWTATQAIHLRRLVLLLLLLPHLLRITLSLILPPSLLRTRLAFIFKRNQDQPRTAKPYRTRVHFLNTNNNNNNNNNNNHRPALIQLLRTVGPAMDL